MCGMKSLDDTNCGTRYLTLDQKSNWPVSSYESILILKNDMRIEVFQRRAPPGLEI